MGNQSRSASLRSRSPLQRWLHIWQQLTHPARTRLQRDPFSRLTSVEEIPIAAALGIRIDANQATIDDWLRLPGISIHQARTLTHLSHSGVSFHCIEDLAAALGIPCRQLIPLRPLLQFCYYDPASTAEPVPISLNQATQDQLLALPGLSPLLAERILNERQRSPFTNWADIHQRLRLTPEQTTQLMYYIRV
ncbi:MAG: helix-hairpin-helix domain-containing protein [Leptolyngbyaceae cyanobacterium]